MTFAEQAEKATEIQAGWLRSFYFLIFVWDLSFKAKKSKLVSLIDSLTIFRKFSFNHEVFVVSIFCDCLLEYGYELSPIE
mgnify:CR=1 FL=1